MKKLIIVLSLVLISLSCFSQRPREEMKPIAGLITLISNNINGVTNFYEENEANLVAIIYPGPTYDFGRIRNEINLIVNSYEDLIFSMPWMTTDEEGSYLTSILFTGKDKTVEFLIIYNDEGHLLIGT